MSTTEPDNPRSEQGFSKERPSGVGGEHMTAAQTAALQEALKGQFEPQRAFFAGSHEDGRERPRGDAYGAVPPAPALSIKGSGEPSGRCNEVSRAEAKWEAIQPVVALPLKSPARSAVMTHCADAAGVSTRTLYRWVARYEKQGVRGLARTKAKSAHAPRVEVSRTFDSAYQRCGYPQEDLRSISAFLDRALKGLWASRVANAGWREVRRLAQFLLFEECVRRNVQIELSQVKISRRRAERFAHYKVINTKANDRKAYEDHKPRIRRDWTGLDPMESVIADVKHLDLLVEREDGSVAWPKIVSFLDAGTGRLFAYPVLLNAREGVRQEHVIEAFLAMATEPTWGFPRGLYLDNGSEFAALARIDSALRLLNEPGVRTIIYARPYNAAAKPIESAFSRLDRYVISLLPGYAGPNRLNKKTQTVGKPPKPFPGSWTQLQSLLTQLIAALNERSAASAPQGRSPQQWLQAKMADGWTPVVVEGSQLDVAFAARDSRRIDRGVLRIGGERLTHPDIAALPTRTLVDIAIPWRRNALPLAKLPDGSWVRLFREPVFPANAIEGARASARQRRAQDQYVDRLRQDAPKIDPIAVSLRLAELERTPLPDVASTAFDLHTDRFPKGADEEALLSGEAEQRALRRRLTEQLEARHAARAPR